MSAAKPKKGLGRGFDSLLPTDMLNEAFDPTATQDEKISELRYIAVSEIIADPDQPRRHFDEEALEELAASLKEHGVVQPLVVVAKSGKYQIVAGERRWRASKLAGLEKVPVLVRTLSDQHKLELSLIENLQRRDLNPLETATAYLKLRDQFNLKLEEMSARVGGKSPSVISNALRLLQLPAGAKKALVEKRITEGHARQILALDDESAKSELLNRIIQEGWSVRQAERFVIGYKKAAKAGDEKASAVRHTRSQTPTTKALSKRLRADVSVKRTAKGGQLIIKFKNDNDLDRITDLIS